MRFFQPVLLSVVFQASVVTVVASSCRCLPGDSCWPTTKQWKALNTTVGGRLVATIPLGSPCHDPTYNATECAILQGEWHDPQLHMNSSSSVMAPFFANQSCDPFTAESKPCTLGNYVDYAVNVTCAADVIAAVNFAQAQNVRFVIRNTGHDYLGKSTGAGALSVWTHYLKDIEFLDWSDQNYKGKAIKMGAGVQGYEAMAAAGAQGLVAVGGECPTIGVAGGYTQGGGHSALSTSFGLAADQTLEWEVVTASGELVTASRAQNADLYWALSGGGGGTYGVVISLTAKAHSDAIVSGASLIFYSSTTTTDIFYAAVEVFHSLLPAMVDAGAMVVYYFSNAFFEISPITAYGKTEAEVKAIMSPLVKALGTLNITFTLTYSQSATYVDHYNTYFGPLPFGNIEVGIAQYGGRLIPRSTVFNNNDALTATVRNITENGVLFIGVGVNVSSPAINSVVSNAVLPAWRDAVVHATLTTPWNFTGPWSEMIALQDKMTYEIVPQLEAVTPGSGAYMNEADFRQLNWQEDFFGDNYVELLSIKNKWDPNHLFYAVTAVGSTDWTVAANGRMCRN
ncbi:FAD-binding domain-containing protein [Hyaloscypha variabilis F]|uniref:FAD-binding domain-containing protein n=1 Tax=Hyaloscypha variabilis (strain UAMH 11265 / GT02V1 / F) TaxID=1149755 RepID=A0A2J6QRA9_HYAVF|nr:FAD-binding domain-containing protein [Hyaloscypha variabilis F]